MLKTLKQYVVDAFTNEVFKGNPAAVCILEKDLPEGLMLKIAVENNLSLTAFAVKQSDGEYRLRWFTPGGEVSLCGHATLATAFILFDSLEKHLDTISFETASSTLVVRKEGDWLTMQFPAYNVKPVEVTAAIAEAIGVKPREAWLAGT